MNRIWIIGIFCLLKTFVFAQASNTKTIDVGMGWANNSLNTVVFRKNSLVTFADTQFIAYYDNERYVVLGKRKLGSNQWQLKRTPYQGNTADAHNTISLMVDGAGYLHLSWDSAHVQNGFPLPDPRFW